MSGHEIQPFQARDAAVDQWQPEPQPPAEWSGDDGGGGLRLVRVQSAVRRFKWLVALCAVIGIAGGLAATRVLPPEYEVQSTILLEQGGGSSDGVDRGPIRAADLLDRSGWQDLLRSYVVVDPVVMDLGLYVWPAQARDSALFRGFRVTDRLRPGSYALRLDGARWTLALEPGAEVDGGTVGDSIGRAVGFLWQPARELLGTRTEVKFSVQTPREASNALVKRLAVTTADENSSLMRLRLTGSNAHVAAATLSRWTNQFVAVATELKKKQVAQLAAILEAQRAYAAEDLVNAESALERFKVRTATEATDRVLYTPSADQMAANPAFDQYFRVKNQSESLRRDREALERVYEEGRRSGAISREAVLSIPSVNADPAADQIRKLLLEQSDREFKLRQLRERFTDEYREVQLARAALEELQAQNVPREVERYLAQVRARESQAARDTDASGRQLRGVPVRAIEEQRLRRKVEVADATFRNLDLKAAQAKLAEAQTIPDVSVLDPAVAPLSPTRNTAPVLLLGGIGAGLALGLLLAVLLDQVDRRFRYPEQATRDLGLFVLGVVPVIDAKGKKRSATQAAQVVEAFRTIRMNCRYAADPARPFALTITSTGPNDGKSLVSSNLALSFAEAGARVLLIDADIRRGELARTFGVPPRPGLVEYLDGTALIAEVLHPTTSHPNLTLMPAGARRRRAPELLATPRLSQLILQMAAEYDVILVDSPPLGAGYDAYALATATGNMVMVLRAGFTDRKMAAAKLATAATLPIRVLGAVLNGIKLEGEYQYYSYYQDYAAHDEEPAPRISASHPPLRQVAAVSSAE